MPNHDGTGPKGCCCNKEEHKAEQKDGGCGCGKQQHKHGEDGSCCQNGEQHRHHGEHHANGGCCHKQEQK